jgi:ribosomal protein S18 acetylase RimI-like enzyme
MEVRRATEADREALRELWHEFMDEVSEPEYWRGTWEEAWAGMSEYIADHIALIAEEGGRAVAYELAKVDRPRIGYVSDLYVRPEGRRRGIAKELLALAARELREQGAHYVTLNVSLDNSDARTVYRRLGFREESVDLIAAIDPLSERVAVREAGPTFGSAHVQTDDQGAIERAVARFVPRLSTSRATVISPVRNGWVAVYDEVADRDPAELRQLGAELSNVTGAVVVALGVEEGRIVRYIAFDRGQIVDEYLSVPEYYGPLPPGDVVALRPNATVMSRLVGADPQALRRVAPIAPSPADLPPTNELLADLARVLGIAGAAQTFDDIGDLEGALLVEHR